MRSIILAVAAATAALTFAAPAIAQQSPSHPWCAQYNEVCTNCGFTTMTQCNDALSGNGGFCEQSMSAAPAPAAAGSTRVQRRRIARQAGSS